MTYQQRRENNSLLEPAGEGYFTRIGSLPATRPGYTPASLNKKLSLSCLASDGKANPKRDFYVAGLFDLGKSKGERGCNLSPHHHGILAETVKSGLGITSFEAYCAVHPREL